MATFEAQDVDSYLNQFLPKSETPSSPDQAPNPSPAKSVSKHTLSPEALRQKQAREDLEVLQDIMAEREKMKSVAIESEQLFNKMADQGESQAAQRKAQQTAAQQKAAQQKAAQQKAAQQKAAQQKASQQAAVQQEEAAPQGMKRATIDPEAKETQIKQEETKKIEDDHSDPLPWVIGGIGITGIAAAVVGAVLLL